MKITHAGTQLTDFEDYPAMNLQFNGQEVVDVAEPLDAVTKFYDRGNQSVSLEFAARREFSSLRLAQVFFFTHFSSIVKQGTCILECGGPGGGSTILLYLPDAVLAATSEGVINGLEVVHRYSIVAPKVQNTEP